jgi:hypothetical protein
MKFPRTTTETVFGVVILNTASCALLRYMFRWVPIEWSWYECRTSLHFTKIQIVRGKDYYASLRPCISANCNWLTPRSRLVFVSHRWLSYWRISQRFTEFKGSLPCSQKAATGPYLERDESCLHQPILFILKSILILSSLISQVWM